MGVHFADDNGLTPLMLASRLGRSDFVEALLENGAPWNSQDANGLTAAEHARAFGHESIYTLLLNHAVRSELIMSALSPKSESDMNQNYLQQRLQYKDGVLLDEEVMSEWNF